MAAPAIPIERRVGERRGQRRDEPQEESWFGAFTALPDSDFHDDGDGAAGDAAASAPRDGHRRGDNDEPGDAGDLEDAGDTGDTGDEGDAGGRRRVAARPPGGTERRRRRPGAAADGRTTSTGRPVPRSAHAGGVGPLAFERLYHAFLSARAVLGTALIATLVASSLFGVPPPTAVAAGIVLYTLLALGMWLALRATTDRHDAAAGAGRLPGRLTAPHWLASIGADIVCFTTLHLLSRFGSFNYAALLVLPVMMAAVLTSRRQALATAAGVSMLLLAGAWLAVLEGGDVTSLMSQAGLAGSGLFLIAVLAGELASRLAREELTAKDSLQLARQQAQLNRLVIEEMHDGVLVVDRRGRVLAANPASRELLSGRQRAQVAAPFQLRGVAAWSALVTTVERAFVDGVWPEAGRDVVLDFGSAGTRTLRVRVRFTRRRQDAIGAGAAAGAEEFCVLLLEDVRSLQARMRQDKLAAMGRVSAGIAHEIRNPLAAIAQANALLAEDADTDGQRQLTRMVADNVERLKRIVDDVMEVAPGEVHDAPTLDLSAQLQRDCADWARAGRRASDRGAAEADGAADGTGPGASAGDLLRLELPARPLGAAFDAEHLRRVLINLLDNARRHARPQAGAVRVGLTALDDAQVQLSVASDGPPITPDVERYLFEPFFSTRSRGTGLGLYICRELCERYGASIDYRQRPAGQSHRNEFVVVMRQRPLPFELPEADRLPGHAAAAA